MLMNEFDLDLDEKENSNSFLNSNFYWLQVRDEVNMGLKQHLVMLMKRHHKGLYKISPNFEIEIE